MRSWCWHQIGRLSCANVIVIIIPCCRERVYDRWINTSNIMLNAQPPPPASPAITCCSMRRRRTPPRPPQEIYFESRGKCCKKLLRYNGYPNKVIIMFCVMCEFVLLKFDARPYKWEGGGTHNAHTWKWYANFNLNLLAVWRHSHFIRSKSFMVILFWICFVRAWYFISIRLFSHTQINWKLVTFL